jgi:hypothetical protein
MWLVLGSVLVVFAGLLVVLPVWLSAVDRRAAARLRGPVGPAERRVWTVAALRQREHADAMPMYPAPPRRRLRPTRGAGPGRAVGGA